MTLLDSLTQAAIPFLPWLVALLLAAVVAVVVAISLDSMEDYY